MAARSDSAHGALRFVTGIWAAEWPRGATRHGTWVCEDLPEQQAGDEAAAGMARADHTRHQAFPIEARMFGQAPATSPTCCGRPNCANKPS